MHVLLSNDDGYTAPGLRAMAEALADNCRITVVAPDRNRSGASNSLTLDRPLMVRQAENGFHYVNGTPTDCVHLAVSGLLPDLPDLVVSGINAGANLGEDTHYSGTVAAAMEGFFLGIPAIAVSLAGAGLRHYATAAAVVRDMVCRHRERPLGAPFLLNVNVPDLPAEDLRGQELTRLGRRHRAQPVVRTESPRGDVVYWIGAVGDGRHDLPGTDFSALAQGKVSVTPLQVDLTHLEQMDRVAAWLTA